MILLVILYFSLFSTLFNYSAYKNINVELIKKINQKIYVIFYILVWHIWHEIQPWPKVLLTYIFLIYLEFFYLLFPIGYRHYT